MDDLKRYEELVKTIEYHNDCYYNQDDPKISDYEYDMMMKELKKIEKDHPEFVTPNSPTQHVGGSAKREAGVLVRHRVPMLSLQDVFSKEEVQEFVESMQETLVDPVFVVEYKIDGLSMALRYENGLLTTAITRGDGIIQGEDVTVNAKVIKDVKNKLKEPIEYLEVRGEVYMTNEAFDKVNEIQELNNKKTFANPRNCAAGTLRQLDSRITKQRNLSMFIFNIQDIRGKEITSHSQGYEYLKKQGMKVIDNYQVCHNFEEVWKAIEDPDKIVVAQVAPAVRAAWGEELGLAPEDATVGKIIDALKRMGINYVFDTTFSADLTIMEEGNEFVKRFTSGELKDRPMFTSCCPGWVRFIKSQFPHLVKYLSSAKSPQQMFGAVMKTYFAEKLGVSPEKIYTVSVMPCVAKKAEREMDLYYEEYAGHDIDAVITTRELIRMIRSAHISPQTLVDVESDRPMHEGTGAGVIFGATGGVMEAALRSAYYIIKGENPPAEAFTAVRSQGFNENDGVQEANFQINDITVRTAVVSGLGNTRELIRKIESGEVHYDFVEVMACPGGCVGGGGQPIHDGEERAFERGKNLYYLDRNANLRFSHENPDVIQMYKEYFEAPMSHKAHMLLHTEHKKNM